MKECDLVAAGGVHSNNAHGDNQEAGEAEEEVEQKQPHADLFSIHLKYVPTQVLNPIIIYNNCLIIILFSPASPDSAAGPE